MLVWLGRVVDLAHNPQTLLVLTFARTVPGYLDPPPRAWVILIMGGFVWK